MHGAGSNGDYSPLTLTGEQFQLVGAICETIVPATETPGAGEAGVDRFIDLMLTEHFPATDRERFLEGLTEFGDSAGQEFGTGFDRIPEERRAGYLRPLDERTLTDSAERGIIESFLGTIKELTLVGYYTSEMGATQELHVNPMGIYQGARAPRLQAWVNRVGESRGCL